MKKIVFFMILTTCSVFACTGLKIQTLDGKVVHGRTLEFGYDLIVNSIIVPRGYTFQGLTPLGKGLTYSAKYAVVGSSLQNVDLVLDGLNEKGLSVACFYFPNYAYFSEVDKKEQSISLSAFDFPNWILTQFASIDEVKSNLKSIRLVNMQIKEWGNIVPPFHYIVYDKKGDSIVIEPLKDGLSVKDNPIGVLTNSPNFDWHITNLSNYINLKAENIKDQNISGVSIKALGQGSGMLGLPGDFSSPSRFVQAVFFAANATLKNTSEEAVFEVFHLLNQFDIPKGSVKEIQNGKEHLDYTLCTAVKDPNTLKYYFKSYEDQTIRVIDLNGCDLNAKKIESIPLNYKQLVIDITPKKK